MSKDKEEKPTLSMLIDRLKACAELKYPERKWSEELYVNISFEWMGKEKMLLERVLKLEKELGL